MAKIKTIKRSKLTNISMTTGQESKTSRAIVKGMVKEWVGIGWIDIRKATKADFKKYPIAVD